MDQIRETNINLVNVVLKLNAIVSLLENKGIITASEFKSYLEKQIDSVRQHVELELKQQYDDQNEVTTPIEKIEDTEVAGVRYLYIDPEDSGQDESYIENLENTEHIIEETLELK